MSERVNRLMLGPWRVGFRKGVWDGWYCFVFLLWI